jgi:hypothetical protein
LAITKNTKLPKPINVIWVVQSPLKKDFCFPHTQISSISWPSRPARGAYRDRHGRWARDVVDAAASGVQLGSQGGLHPVSDDPARKTTNAVADGEVVWS